MRLIPSSSVGWKAASAFLYTRNFPSNLFAWDDADTKRVLAEVYTMSKQHPTPETSMAIAQDGIFQAGGFEGPHPADRTLSVAGLATSQQRSDFQFAVDREARKRNFKLDDITKVPNGAGTTVQTVSDHVQTHATARTIKE